MKCRHCGRQLPEDAMFCPECGKKVENEASKDFAKETLRQVDQLKEKDKTETPDGIPDGYKLDPRNGLYYIAEQKINPETGRTSRYVTYFNPETKEVFSAYYPLGKPDKTIQKTTKKPLWIVLAVLISVILMVGAIAIIFVAVEHKGVAEKLEDSEDSSRTSWQDERERLEEEEVKRQEELERLKEVEPLVKSGNKNTWMDFPQNSFAYVDADEDEKYIYFSSYIEDKDPMPRKILRYNKDTKKIETVIDAGPNSIIYNFCVAGDYIIYNIMGTLSDYSASQVEYYYLNMKDTTEKGYIFTAPPEQMILYQGYVYVLMDEDVELRKIGIQKNGEINYESIELDLMLDAYIYDENMSIVDGALYINTIDWYGDSERFFKYDLKTEVVTEIYVGEPEVIHDQMFLYQDYVYFADTTSVSDNVLINRAKMGDYGSEEVIAKYENPDSNHAFLARVGNKMYYLFGDEVVTASLQNPKDSKTLFEVESLPYAITPSGIIMQNHIYKFESGSMEELVEPGAETIAMVEHDGEGEEGEYDSRNSEEYAGGILFNAYDTELFNATAFVLSEAEDADYISDYDILENSRAFFENEYFLKNMTNTDGSVDVQKMNTLLDHVFYVFSYNFQEMVESGIDGFLYEDGKIYLDEQWQPRKKIAEIVVDSEEGYSEYVQRLVRIVYDDGEEIEYTLYYTYNLENSEGISEIVGMFFEKNS